MMDPRRTDWANNVINDILMDLGGFCGRVEPMEFVKLEKVNPLAMLKMFTQILLEWSSLSLIYLQLTNATHTNVLVPKVIIDVRPN